MRLTRSIFLSKSYVHYLTFLVLYLGLFPFQLKAQTLETQGSAELRGGYTAAANSQFPERSIQKQAVVHFSWYHPRRDEGWKARFPKLERGISLGITDFGNTGALGYAISVMPELRFPIFNSQRLVTELSAGASYFTKRFNRDTNPFNQAVTTRFTWSASAFLYYRITGKQTLQTQLGLGLVHHSNGHMRLPNQGFNSFLGSLRFQWGTPSAVISARERSVSKPASSAFYSIRFGLGQQVFNDNVYFNQRKEVGTLSLSYGKRYRDTFSWDIGAFYRIYEHYYDYINDGEFLVREGQEFEAFADNPWSNATAFGIFGQGELILNHVGIAFMVGLNLHKPAYRIDWRINEGWDLAPRELPPYWQYGDFNSKFRLKHLFATRMGFKYYLKAVKSNPKHNLFVGAFINANLGQADFSELGLGYVHRLGK